MDAALLAWWSTTWVVILGSLSIVSHLRRLRDLTDEQLLLEMGIAFTDWMCAEDYGEVYEQRFNRLSRELTRRHRRARVPGCVCRDCFRRYGPIFERP